MHTQGPWHHEQALAAPSRRQVAAFSGDGNRVLQVVIHSFNPDEDALLIAAAPDLLAALENLVDFCEQVFVKPKECDDMIAARAALHLAKHGAA